MENTIKIIGLSGNAGAGKDEFCKCCMNLMSINGIQCARLSIGDIVKYEMKEFIEKEFGFDIMNCHREEKNIIRGIIVEYGKSKRNLTEGTYFTKKIEELIKLLHHKNNINHFIITDIRYCEDEFYPNDELWWLKETMTGVLVYIDRYEKANSKIKQYMDWSKDKVMKDISKVAFIVQARLNSQRVPQKMIRPFAGTTLFDLVLDKLLASSFIPKENIIASVYEPQLFDIALKKGVNIFNRSKLSANAEDSLTEIYEWHDKLEQFDYVVLISGCNPLLKVSTIDKFAKQFIEQEEENLFAVIEKKQYYWNKEGKLITPWPEELTIMNTKIVEPTYEAAHVLYASRLDIIKDYRFMGDFQAENGIKLMVMPELEAFDIDYEWQFKVGETLYV